jgi:hypothetical protein
MKYHKRRLRGWNCSKETLQAVNRWSGGIYQHPRAADSGDFTALLHLQGHSASEPIEE